MILAFKALFIALISLVVFAAKQELGSIDSRMESHNTLVVQLREDLQNFRGEQGKFQEDTATRFSDIVARISDLMTSMASLAARVDGLEKRIDASEREAELRRQVWLRSVDKYDQDATDWRRREAQGNGR